jgi:hypothetical protein
VYFNNGGAWNHNGTVSITITNTTAGPGAGTCVQLTHWGSTFAKRYACPLLTICCPTPLLFLACASMAVVKHGTTTTNTTTGAVVGTCV